MNAVSARKCKIMLASAAVGGMLVAPFASPATAHADIYTDAFLQTLHNKGFFHDRGDAGLIALGGVACSRLANNGGSIPDAINYIYQNSGDTIDMGDAGYFVGASIGAFCPEYRPADMPAPPVESSIGTDYIA